VLLARLVEDDGHDLEVGCCVDLLHGLHKVDLRDQLDDVVGDCIPLNGFKMAFREFLTK